MPKQHVDYFTLDGATPNNTFTTAAFMLVSYMLAWVSFVPMIEWVAGLCGIQYGDIGTSVLTQAGLETYFKLIAFTTLPAIAFYLPLCCGLDYHYYRCQSDSAATWKWQVLKFPTRQDRLDMLWLSCRNLLAGGILTSTLLTYHPTIFNIYTDVNEYGSVYYVGNIVTFFLHIDIMAYLAHRMMHRPMLYRNFHKVHHRFIAVSPMTALSMHWAEYLTQVVLTFTYLWVVPTHLNAAIVNLLYVFIFNIVNHSGVKIGSHLSWEATTQYHDDHHKYFHVNYGQSLTLWDKLCGTLRTHDGSYGEDKFD